MNEIIAFHWDMDKAGSGVLFSFTDRQSVLLETKQVFQSLDEIPDWMAKEIREDGRPVGEWSGPPAPSL
jgi:hypothetical protein